MSGKEQLFEVSLEREGVYRSISAALEAAERCVSDTTVPVRVLVAPGEYREQVEIRRPHVTLEGETADSVRIVGGLGAKMPSEDGSGQDGRLGTFRTYTVLVDADDVTLAGLTIENTPVMGARSARRLPCMPMVTAWLSMPAALRDTRTRSFWGRCRRARPSRAAL